MTSKKKKWSPEKKAKLLSHLYTAYRRGSCCIYLLSILSFYFSFVFTFSCKPKSRTGISKPYNVKQIKTTTPEEAEEAIRCLMQAKGGMVGFLFRSFDDILYLENKKNQTHKYWIGAM